jgi:hypothetical protein
VKAIVTSDGVLFSGDLPAGRIAYVDGAQTNASGTVEAMIVEAGGEGDDPGAALSALLAPIRAALAAVEGALDVLGEGAVAAALRAERAGPAAGEPPAVVVDLTGDPERIRDATRRLADLGTLVLGRDPAAPCDLDLYPDVHVRGLRLVGAPPAVGVRADGNGPSAQPDVVEARAGAPAPRGAALYRVSAGSR